MDPIFYTITNSKCPKEKYFLSKIKNVFEFAKYDDDTVNEVQILDNQPFILYKKYKLDKLINIKSYKLFDINTLSYLINLGADIQAGNNSLFIRACAKGYLPIVKLLIENKEDIGDKDSAINSASINGRVEIVKLLLELGADISSAITGACSYSRGEDINILKLLIEYDNSQSIKIAGITDNIETIQLLIAHGVDIQINNNSFLATACNHGNIQLIKLLIEA